MNDLCVAPIIEGHGENEAIGILLRRIAGELSHVSLALVRPFRLPKGKLLPGRPGARRINHDELGRALNTAFTLLKYAAPSARRFALLLFDADDDLPCDLAPRVLAAAQQLRSDLDLACVIARREYETWFVAAAESLGKFLHLRADDMAAAADPEGRLPGARPHGEKWISDRFRGVSYQKTVDQAKLTAAMDLSRCRERSPSFDKLCRELELRGAKSS